MLDTSSSTTLDRMNAHRAALLAFGIDTLDDLGTMKIAGEVLVPPSGLTSPRLPNLVAGTSVCRSAQVYENGRWLPVTNRTMRSLAAEPPPRTLQYPRSYWAATEIVIPTGTRVVLSRPLGYLTIITHRLVVGSDVTFTWQQPDLPSATDIDEEPPAQGEMPSPTAQGHYGAAGLPGRDGQAGNRGYDGHDGPEFELWVLEMQGHPAFDLRGQAGGRGGRGQRGGRGGKGGQGRPSHSTTFDCRRGPGFGGRGGFGGTGGAGGSGGIGGHGGRLSVFAPAPVLLAYTRDGFQALASGGSPGVGGDGGAGGEPGDGGEPGAATRRCKPDPDRRGQRGERGHTGPTGGQGRHGGHHVRPTALVDISAEEFLQKWSAPAITGLEPRVVKAGDTVTLSGLRLSPTDQVLVAGASQPLELFGDAVAQFAVPVTWGGRVEVRVRQSDGTLSNPDSLMVLPTAVTADPAEQVLPGSRVTVTGTGFSAGARVRGNGQDMTGVEVLGPDRLQFTLDRPAVVEPSRLAEQVRLEVLLPTGETSNPLPVTLDTYRIAVLGDSVAWGQGLEEHEKASAHVTVAVEREHAAGRMVYVDRWAHSGAPILSDEPDLPPVHGEVPTTHPTVTRQLQLLDRPDQVELVLISAGINDVNVRNVLTPLKGEDDLGPLIDQCCGKRVEDLLRQVLSTCTQARVVVTGYFPILSRESNLGLVEPLLLAMGAFTGGGLAGSIVGTVALQQVLNNCWFFYERSRTALRRAVDAVNATEPVPRVALATPEFTASNAALAPHAWLFGVGVDTDVVILPGPVPIVPIPQPVPVDSPSVSGPRAAVCEAVGDGRTIVWQCKVASAGHPNTTGAHQYAQAILHALATLPEPARARALSPQGQLS